MSPSDLSRANIEAVLRSALVGGLVPWEPWVQAATSGILDLVQNWIDAVDGEFYELLFAVQEERDLYRDSIAEINQLREDNLRRALAAERALRAKNEDIKTLATIIGCRSEAVHNYHALSEEEWAVVRYCERTYG